MELDHGKEWLNSRIFSYEWDILYIHDNFDEWMGGVKIHAK